MHDFLHGDWNLVWIKGSWIQYCFYIVVGQKCLLGIKWSQSRNNLISIISSFPNLQVAKTWSPGLFKRKMTVLARLKSLQDQVRYCWDNLQLCKRNAFNVETVIMVSKQLDNFGDVVQAHGILRVSHSVLVWKTFGRDSFTGQLSSAYFLAKSGSLFMWPCRINLTFYSLHF